MKRIISVFTLVCLFIIGVNAQSKQLGLIDVWGSRTFFPNSIDEIRSMNDGETYTVLADNSIVQYSYKNGKEVKTLLKGSALKLNGKAFSLDIEDYTFSDDESMILLTTGMEMIYRHSYNADYYIYFLKTQELKKLSVGGKQSLAEFSPDGKHMAFVRDNNIYLVDISNMQETQMTSDGEFNKIIYGAPDWVYEEEFGFSKGFFWSPDGKRIAYYRFDESEVKQYTLMNYNGSEYPEPYTFKYPKAGEANSVVDVYVYHLDQGKHEKMDLGSEQDQYIPRIGWTQNPEILWVQRMNRLQNHLEILMFDVGSGQNKKIYSEDNKYYIDITDNLTFLKDGKHFIFTSEKSGYNHIYLFDINGTELNSITAGEWDVMSLVNVDETNRKVYYTSSETGPQNQMLYSVSFEGTDKKLLFDRPGTYEAEFSEGSKYFILTYSDANTPYQYAIYDNKLKRLMELETNSELIANMKEYGFVKKEFFNFKTSENIELNGWMMKPEKMITGKKYPVLMYVYGGPGSQTVENSWGWYDFIWFQMLVQNDIIVVSVDNRGTGGRGEEFKKCTYLELGKLETEDQIEAAKYVQTLPYVDKDNIGIFGWSYGGYMSALCMTKGAAIFKAGIAVAPVTNWRYYDNIYTERFMRTPQENADGYDKNSPAFHAKKLKGPLLIVHGDADDNVHVQNTMEFVDALINANKQFDMMVYPNKNHGIYGGWTRFHLYTKMTDFIYNNLKSQSAD
jgi:dipeptidyl-peptidase 4